MLNTIDVSIKLIPRVPLSIVRYSAPVWRLYAKIQNEPLIDRVFSFVLSYNLLLSQAYPLAYLRWNCKSRLCKWKNTCNSTLQVRKTKRKPIPLVKLSLLKLWTIKQSTWTETKTTAWDWSSQKHFVSFFSILNVQEQNNILQTLNNKNLFSS